MTLAARGEMFDCLSFFKWNAKGKFVGLLDQR